MSASNTPPPPGGDPSMEDILASIRRILSEDEQPADPTPATALQSNPPASPTPPLHPAFPPLTDPATDPGLRRPAGAGNVGAEKDVFVLDASMMVDEPTDSAAVESMMTDPADPVTGYAPAEPFSASPYADERRGLRGDGGEHGSLVAPEAAAAAASSVHSLVRALTERTTQVHQGGPTIEDLVRDEIRPVLKQWLDANLPPLVERLVRLEIERVVGRAVP